MGNTIFFMHIPKTAGTSVRHSAQQYFGEDRALLLYGDGARSTSPALQERFHGTWSTLTHRERSSKLSDFLIENDVTFFSSHIQMDRLSCFEPQRAFTIVREPVGRVISHYHQYLKMHPKLTIEEFIALSKNQNVQSRTLNKTSLDQIAVIGLQDQFEETLARVNRHFQIELKYEKLNTAPLLTQIKNRFLSKELLQKIRALNEKDLDLYERACQRFKEQA